MTIVTPTVASVAIWRRLTRPYWITREPPENWVGVTFASSAPDIVSKTSFATLSPSWTNAAPITVGDRTYDNARHKDWDTYFIPTLSLGYSW